MRSFCVVVRPPLFDDDFVLLEAIGDLSVEQFVPEFSVKAKGMALSGNSWSASGSKSSCAGPYCRNESAWDYLPGSRQWRCRDTGGARGGEFVPSSECSSQRQIDNWP